jgi:hypothetical protein
MVKVTGLNKTRRKKPTKTFSRRARTGFDAAPTKTFLHLSEYVRMEVDRQQIVQKVKSYVKENYKKDQILLQAPDWAYAACLPFACSLHWAELNKKHPDNWDHDAVEKRAIAYIREQAEKKLAEDDSDKPKVNIVTRSPMEIVKDRTEDFIGAVEEVLDDFHRGIDLDVENYSPYNELQKIDAAYNIAKGVYDYYSPLREELVELIEKKSEDLVEAYSHLKPKKKKEYLRLVEIIVEDAERYMNSKKAQRKIRKPKVKSADKQVAKVQYQKESDEYKITSIDPAAIVGARRVYLFNTKERFLIELVCRLPGGFEVSGTTVKGLDEDQSRQIRLRKPMDFIPIVQSKTPTQIAKEWKTLTTVEGPTTGRINKNTIILRALDK